MTELKKPERSSGQLETFDRTEVEKAHDNLAAEHAFMSKLHNMYLECAMHKELIAREWRDYTDFYRGLQWPARRPHHKVSAVLNFVVENIERKTALLTDAKPIPKVVPLKDQMQDTADILNELIRVIFHDSDFSQASVELLETAQVFGSGFMTTVFDRHRNGKGDVRVLAIDPRAVYIDPIVLKSYLLCEGEVIIVEDIWSLEKARDMFPKRADLIKPDPGLSRYESHESPGLFRAMIERVFKHREQNVLKSEIPRVHMREFWLRDRSKDTNDKPRFKNNSRKVMLAGQIIVDDGDNPYSDGIFPQDMLAWHTDFHSAWGWGDVELLKNPQQLMNKIMATVVENLVLSSNAIWIGDADALSKEEWDKLSNKPGSFVRKKRGRELRREPGLHFPEYVLKVMEYVGSSKDVITGMVDVMRGLRTGQVSSGVAIESLQLMAQALIRLRSRALEALQARIGRKLVSRIFQFYEPERIIEMLRISGDEGELVKPIDTALIQRISARGPQFMNDLIFKIEPGSSLGLAKTQRRIESFRLREAQVIDNRALLEDLEYPGREKVLKRTEAKLQDAENQEVVSKGQGGGSRGTQFPAQSGSSPKGRF